VHALQALQLFMLIIQHERANEYAPLASESYALKHSLSSPSHTPYSRLTELRRNATHSLSISPSPTNRRPRPDDIFIHPNQSNIARADAVALQLGLAGATDFVSTAGHIPSTPKTSGPKWEHGKGKELARAMMKQSPPPDPHSWNYDSSPSDEDSN
jgi:hypothetical protein